VYDDSKILSDDESFLSSGILDSTGVLELIAFLEETYHVHFDDEELVAENFDSLSRLTRFMVSKLDSKSA
jgi:acyl carrier protein